MGEFLVRQVERRSDQLVAEFSVPNFVADEALEQVYRQIFPPHDDALNFVLGVAGPDTSGPYGRPQGAGGGATVDKSLTWSDCTDSNANEGGCYTDAMRTSFGYSRRDIAFTASRVSEGGLFESNECTFSNDHSWTPQDGEDWDNPDTEDEIEQPPPEWNGSQYPEPIIGFPWQWPRKTCEDIGTPPNQRESYMGEWAPDGTLDWLCDFRKIGGFPITLAFLGDGDQNKLVAAGIFRRPVLLWPGTTLYIRYRARIFSIDSLMTGAFAERFARFTFEKTGSRYSTIYVRPVLSTFIGPVKRTTTYTEIEPHFVPEFDAESLSSWTFVSGADPKRMESDTIPQWTNSSGEEIGPIGWLAVYGFADGSNELMWMNKLEPAVTVPNGDTLRVPNKVRFWLEGL